MHDPDQPALYKLTIGLLPDAAPASAVTDTWRFDMFDPSGRHLLTDFTMDATCSNGGNLCVLAIAPAAAGTVTSEIVPLTRGVTLSNSNSQAPYALILPGFADANWVFENDSPETAHMHFLTTVPQYPDLSKAIIWIRTACGSQ